MAGQGVRVENRTVLHRCGKQGDRRLSWSLAGNQVGILVAMDADYALRAPSRLSSIAVYRLGGLTGLGMASYVQVAQNLPCSLVPTNCRQGGVRGTKPHEGDAALDRQRCHLLFTIRSCPAVCMLTVMSGPKEHSPCLAVLEPGGGIAAPVLVNTFLRSNNMGAAGGGLARLARASGSPEMNQVC